MQTELHPGSSRRTSRGWTTRSDAGLAKQKQHRKETEYCVLDLSKGVTWFDRGRWRSWSGGSASRNPGCPKKTEFEAIVKGFEEIMKRRSRNADQQIQRIFVSGDDRCRKSDVDC